MKLVYTCEAHTTQAEIDTDSLSISSKQRDMIPGLAMPACLLFTWIGNARHEKDPTKWPQVPNPECRFILSREIP